MVDLMGDKAFEWVRANTDTGPNLSLCQHPVSHISESRYGTQGNRFQPHVSESPVTSESQLESQLQFAAGKVGIDDAVTGSGVGCDAVGSLCVGMIEYVEGISSEFNAYLLKAQRKALVDAEIEVGKAGGAGDVARTVAVRRGRRERVGYGDGPRRRSEILILSRRDGRPAALGQNRISD